MPTESVCIGNWRRAGIFLDGGSCAKYMVFVLDVTRGGVGEYITMGEYEFLFLRLDHGCYAVF